MPASKPPGCGAAPQNWLVALHPPGRVDAAGNLALGVGLDIRHGLRYRTIPWIV